MERYFVNTSTLTNPHHNHEVHKTGKCPFGNLVPAGQRQDLGEQPNEIIAVAEARKFYSNADGCAICCSKANRE